MRTLCDCEHYAQDGIKGAFAVCASRIVVNVFVHLQDTAEGMDVDLIVRPFLKGQIGNDVGELRGIPLVFTCWIAKPPAS